jgi:hypothetical protein
LARALIDGCGQGVDARMSEQLIHGDGYSQLSLNPRLDLGHNQGMPAYGEEVVVISNITELQFF